MEIRLEAILTLSIIGVFFVSTMMKFTDNIKKNNIQNTELEFEKTTFTDVDNNMMQAKAFSIFGVQKGGVLSLENLTYHTKNIKKLSANKAIYKENILYLEGNVTLNQKEGFTYKTQNAKYNQKTQILEITSAFEASMEKNSAYGKSLQYNALKKEVDAQMITASFYMSGK